MPMRTFSGNARGCARRGAERPLDFHGHVPVARAPACCRGRVAAHAATLETPAVPKVVPDDPAGLKQSIVDAEAKYVLQTYARPPELVITHGSGCKVYDVSGKEYVDFSGGIAVNCLGHSDARWLDTVTQQAGQLTHTSNLYHTVPHVQLAERLVTASFADKVFFCNSGAEANEAAIKFARKYARQQAGVEYQNPDDSAAPSTFVAFTGSFHGRTMGAVALTAKTQYQYPFAPIMPGVKQVPFLDLEAARQAIKKGETCAVFVEPVQGEGGVTPATADFLRGLRSLCDDAGALLVFDEVQCGLGRTGKLWGHQHADVEPDIMTMAKPLAGGLPIGAVLLKQHVADAMAPGDHGSTFAGNPLVCAAGVTVFDIVNEPHFLQEVTRKGEKLRDGLRTALADNPHVKEVRGSGLLVGVQLDASAADVVKAARDEGVLVITAGAGDVIRFAPPLVCLDEEIDVVVNVVAKAINMIF